MPTRRVSEHFRVIELGFTPIAKTDGHRRALTGTEGIEQNRDAFGIHGIDVVEHQGRSVFGADVVHQRLQLVGPAAPIERNVDVLQLTLLLEQREIFAHVLERHDDPS